MSLLSAPDLDELLLSPAFLIDPYPVYQRLRREAPVYWCAPWECWVLTRYVDIQSALREDGRSLSVAGRIQAALRRLPEADQAQLDQLDAHYGAGLLHTDAPDHTRLRALVNSAFNRRLIDAMLPAIQVTVDALLDDLSHAHQADVIRDFAFPLPATVVATVLGLPVEDHQHVKVWIDQLNAFLGHNHASVHLAQQAQAGLLELREYVRGLVAERADHPRQDLISHLVSGDGMSEAELLSTLVTFIVGGHVTTTALIGNGLLALFDHADAFEHLRARPTLLPTAVEEFLRYESPNQRIMRLAKLDVELGGTRVERGQAIMLLLGAGNRDPDQFPDPDRLDLERTPNRHLAFAAGAHFCIGAPLARLEAQLALRSLLDRFPRIRPAGGGPDWVRSYTLRVLQSMPVLLD